MNLIILVDASTSLTKKAGSVLTRLEMVKAFCRNFNEPRFRAETQLQNIYLFDSQIYLRQNIESLVGFDNVQHVKKIIETLKPLPNTNLYQSFMFLLNFVNFVNFQTKSENYFGSRDTDSTIPFMVF